MGYSTIERMEHGHGKGKADEVFTSPPLIINEAKNNTAETLYSHEAIVRP